MEGGGGAAGGGGVYIKHVTLSVCLGEAGGHNRAESRLEN